MRKINISLTFCFYLFCMLGNCTFVRPDLGPNCLQRLSADDTSRQRVNGTVLRMPKPS